MPEPQFAPWVLLTGITGASLYSEQMLSYNHDVSDCTIGIFFFPSQKWLSNNVKVSSLIIL